MKKYNNEIYMMYEEEVKKNNILSKEVEYLKLENKNYKYELDYKDKTINNKINKAVKEATVFLNDELEIKSNELKKAYAEIERLKSQIEKQNYKVDKLECQVNKDSTNSSIPTSKEISAKHPKTGANIYNHREKSYRKTGGQIKHEGKTLTKENLLTKIKENNIEIKKVTHYINGNSNQKDIIKYKIGMNVEMYVEEHIFKHTSKSKKKFPLYIGKKKKIHY